MAPPADIPDRALVAAQDALRGAVAADPGLLEDDARYRAAAAEAASAATPGDDASRGELERVLLAMRGQLAEAGS